MSQLVIVLPVGRRYCGRGLLLGADGGTRVGPFRILATASGWAARRHGNETRDWRRPYGHPPTGTYVVTGSLPPGFAPRPRRAPRFGSLGALVLTPVGGDALEALKAGRSRFLIHGGPTDESGRLRPTFGGFRLFDQDLSRLLQAVNEANAASDPLWSIQVAEAQGGAADRDVSDRAGRFRPSFANRNPLSIARMPLRHAALCVFGFGLIGSRDERGGHGDPEAGDGCRRRDFVGLAIFLLSSLGPWGCGSGPDTPGVDTVDRRPAAAQRGPSSGSQVSRPDSDSGAGEDGGGSCGGYAMCHTVGRGRVGDVTGDDLGGGG